MAQTHLSYSQFKDIYGDLGVTEWTKYNWLADYWKELTPDGFERVQWLQSDGNQYIDLGIYGHGNTKFDLDVWSDGSNVNTAVGLFGSIGAGSVKRFEIFITNDKYIEFGYDDTYYKATPFIGRQHIIQDKNIGYVNDTAYTIKASPATFTTESTMYLFNMNRDPMLNNATIKLYSCYISEDDSYVQYLIPMVRTSDNKPGLYDLINHQFYTNQGLLDFLAGPPVGYTQVEYLESAGTQYIDTGIMPTTSTKYELDVQFTSIAMGELNINGRYNWPGDRIDFGADTTGQMFLGAGGNVNTGIAMNLDRHYVTFDAYDGTIKVDSTTYQASTTSFDPADQEPGNTILIGARHAAQSPGSLIVQGYCKEKIYGAKHSSGLTVTNILIPTLDSTNRPCMYDLITRQPFYNQGTGEFTWG